MDMDTKKYWTSIPVSEIPSSLVIDPHIYANVEKGSKIIDLGCGSSFTLPHLERQGYKNLFGIDINKNVIDYFRDTFKESGTEVFNYDVTENGLESNAFDYAIMEALLTVLVDNISIHKALCETYRILKKGAILQIDDFFQNWHNKLYRDRYTKGETELEIEGAFVVYNNDNNIRYFARHFSIKELPLLLEKVGFCDIRVIPKDVMTQSGNGIIGFSLFARK